MEYDVIIVGGGPAGAYAAYNLAQTNLNVVLLEKEELPRYKCCGGAVSLKVRDILTDINLDSVIEDKVARVIFNYNFSQPIEINFSEPFVYMVMRDRLDEFLIIKAQEAGAKVIDNKEVIDLVREKDEIKIKTEEDSFSTKFVVGADGANSLVAQKLDLMKDLEYAIAYEKELKVSNSRLTAQRGVINLDYGVISKGYSWIFPKANHLSVGIGTYVKGLDLKERLTAYLSKQDLDSYKEVMAKGHLIPVGGNNQKLNNQWGLLVGDAAGLADPLSGEGIFYALKSADLASQVIVNACLGKNSLDRYTELINQEISPELKKAKLISKLFFNFPKLLHKLFNKKPNLLKGLIRVIYGDQSYSDLYNNLKSELPFLKFKE